MKLENTVASISEQELNHVVSRMVSAIADAKISILQDILQLSGKAQIKGINVPFTSEWHLSVRENRLQVTLKNVTAGYLFSVPKSMILQLIVMKSGQELIRVEEDSLLIDVNEILKTGKFPARITLNSIECSPQKLLIRISHLEFDLPTILDAAAEKPVQTDSHTLS